MSRTDLVRRISSVVLTVLALAFTAGVAEAKVVATKKLQIVISFVDADLFAYHSNVGGFITQDLTYTNPPGSTYIFKGGLFLGDTVDLAQASYTVDREGTPLSAANSIGTWYCTGTRLVDWNLSGIDFPDEGTFVEEANWSLIFKSIGTDGVNAVYSKGWIVAEQFGVGGDTVVATSHQGIVAGTGPNAYAQGDMKAQTFLSPDGLASLTVLEFSNPVKVEVPDNH